MTLNSISKPDQSMMLDQLIVINGGMAQASALSTRGAGADIDPVDMAALAAFGELQEDGEPDLVVELIDLYLQEAPLRIEAIQRAVADADGLSLKRAAHSLKGSSGTLGVLPLAALCEELERLAADALSPEATVLVNRLEEEFVRAHNVLAYEQQVRRLPGQRKT
jgi:HPt (histidine-containing phosphotransfer) domain-containing protein